jgi:GntR family transcriptional regulator
MFKLDTQASTPAFRQIIAGFRALLVAGKYKPGDKLPPVRELARQLEVHHNTVAEAYRVLAAEGWIELVRRRGATVLRRTAPNLASGEEEAFTRHLRELVAEGLTRGLSPAAVAHELRTLATTLSWVKKEAP